MFFRDVVNSGTLPAMEKMLAFTQARHRVLAENIANVDTPGYQVKQVDAKAFQQSLRKAMDLQKSDRSAEFRISGNGQVSQDGDGRLVLTPTTEPAENILFHDHTNLRIETQMAMMAENAMMHQTVTELMRGKFEQLLNAIRGRS